MIGSASLEAGLTSTHLRVALRLFDLCSFPGNFIRMPRNQTKKGKELLDSRHGKRAGYFSDYIVSFHVSDGFAGCKRLSN